MLIWSILRCFLYHKAGSMVILVGQQSIKPLLMKNFFLLLTLLTSSEIFCQLDSSLIRAIPTTMEEYNYMTKGYKIQVESGLDMKKGYYFVDMGEHKIGNYVFNVKKLVRENRQELAGTLIISHAEISGKTYYTAIPVNNAELMKLYGAEVGKWDSGLTSAYCYLISAYLSDYILSAHLAQEKP